MNPKPHETSGIEMAGKAVHLLRATPLHTLMAYYLGSVPFVLALLYFWSEMSRSAFAAPRCFGLSILLAALFLWMKCWQSVFAAGLRAVLTGVPARRPSFRNTVRLIMRQGATQPYGLLLIPAAMVVMVPFYAVHAFFQNMTVLDDGSEPDTRLLIQRSWRQAKLWPRQNHVALWLVSPWVLLSVVSTLVAVVWLADIMKRIVPADAGEIVVASLFFLIAASSVPLCPFGCTVAINVAVTLVLLPALIEKVFGVSTVFVQGGTNAFLNTTFLTAVLGISYLCLDPIVKSVHVLRCFQGEALQSGVDLLAELQAFRENKQ